MRRKQSHLDDDMRTSVQERYPINFEERRKAMQAIVGIWKDRDEFEDSEAYIRRLRRDTRLKRIRHD